MEAAERRTMFLFAFTLGIVALSVGIHLFLLLILGYDFGPALFGRVSNMLTTLKVLVVVFLIALIFWQIYFILWLQTLWQKEFPTGRRWFPQLFWLIFLPGIGQIFTFFLLLFLGWKRDRKTFILTLFYSITGILILLNASTYKNFSITTARTFFDNILSYTSTANMISQSIGIILILNIIFLFLLIPRIGKFRLSRKSQWCGYALAVFAALTYTCSILTVNYVNTRVAELKKELRKQKASINYKEILAAYLHGLKPDQVWTDIVNKKEFMKKDGPEEKLLASPVVSRKIKYPANADWENFRSELKKQDRFIRTLDSVFNRTPVKYSLNGNVTMTCAILLPHLTVLRECMRLYTARIRLALKDGNRVEAMRLYRLSGNIVRTALDEKFLIGSLVGLVSISWQIQCVADMLASHILTEKDIAEIEAYQRELEQLALFSMKEAFRSEVAMSDALESLISENLKRSTTLNPMNSLLYCFLMNDYTFLLKSWKETLSDIDSPDFDPWIGPKSMNEQEASNPNLHFYPVSGMLFPILGSIWKKEVEIQAYLRMGRIACEIERFRRINNRLPDSLQELAMRDIPADPFTGKPFVYRHGRLDTYSSDIQMKTPNGSVTGFRLYGVGKNLVDDGGKYNFQDDILTVTDPDSFRKKAQ